MYIKKIRNKHGRIHIYFLGIKIFSYRPKNSLKRVQRLYAKKIKLLRQKENINVIFLVWENCKWSYDSVYRKLAKSSRYHPMIIIVDEKLPPCNLEKNCHFFKDKGYHFKIVKDADELKQYEPDIIFYEQPWFALNNGFSPEKLSELALCLYVPYNVELDLSDRIIFPLKKFYLTLYKTFIFNDAVKNDMIKYRIKNVFVAGHPRLDAYLEPVLRKSLWSSQKKMHIIYAPHHSFAHSTLKWATYEWNGQHLLDLAKKYADTTEWIFKPHPRFHFALEEEFGKEYADKVFADWSKVSKLYDTGDYFDLFRTSDLMISDCCSFKLEWLPTGKPYLNLVSQYPDADFIGPIREHFSSSYYHANNIKQIDQYFDMLVNQRADPLKPKRKDLIKQIPSNAAQRICNFINNLLERKNEKNNHLWNV